MQLFLGLDGGGSGCRAAVADAGGRVIGRGESAPANVWSDPDGALASIVAAARAAMAAADAGEDLSRVTAVLGLAGANVPGTGEALAPRLPFASARIEWDAPMALKGALGPEDGITAAIGTGSVFGAQRRGAARMIGGWGFLIGDRGGGARIGRAALETAILAHDGLTTQTPLLRQLLADHGGPAGIVGFGRSAAPADFARLVPQVLAAETAGDPAGRTIMAGAEAAVAAAIDALQADGPLPVCFLGGLGPEFARRLASRYPGMIRPAAGTGLDAAVAMARGALA